MSNVSTVSLMLLIVFIFLRFNLENEELPGIINEVDDFILTSQNGETITKLDLLDKYTVLDFIFTEYRITC